MSKLYNTDHLEHLTELYGLRPSKNYGQNFLIDEEVIEKIISATDLDTSQTVVEVGPGFGVLTFALAPVVKKVVAFEIEKKLEKYWVKSLPDKQIKNVEIVWGNILYTQEVLKTKISGPYKVVANLPYQITSPVIRLFLECDQPPTEMVVMVQKEVGERLSALPGQMSVLTIAAQYYAGVEYLFTVPKTSFWPSPKVDSAVIRIKLKPELKRDLPAEDRFFKLIKLGFSSPRKKLTSNLKSLLNATNKTVVLDRLVELGHPMDVRAQALSVSDWQELAKILLIDKKPK